jgi:predicted metal-binding membrane protein
MTTLALPQRRIPLAIPAAVGIAWALAGVAQATGVLTHIHHAHLFEGGPSVWVALPIFVLAWQVMLAAMMLPSSLPLINLFIAASRTQPRPTVVRALFLGGYAVVWTIFGVLAFVADAGVHLAVDSIPWLDARPWLVAGLVLAAAGLFQYSSLKERCLEECRHPAAYLLRFYRRGSGAAFRLGAGHGLFCLGCCWALMLVMFAVGVAHLLVMAVLTALMVYEKTGRHGRGLARIAGAVLVVWAAAVLAQPRWLPDALVLDTGAAAAGPGAVTVGLTAAPAVMRSGGYRVELTIEPNRRGVRNELVLRATKRGRLLRDADLQASFEMLSMSMGIQRYSLVERRPGVYSLAASPFAMPGDWGIGIEVTPHRGAPVSFRLVDRVRS